MKTSPREAEVRYTWKVGALLEQLELDGEETEGVSLSDQLGQEYKLFFLFFPEHENYSAKNLPLN